MVFCENWFRFFLKVEILYYIMCFIKGIIIFVIYVCLVNVVKLGWYKYYNDIWIFELNLWFFGVVFIFNFFKNIIWYLRKIIVMIIIIISIIMFLIFIFNVDLIVNKYWENLVK